MSITNGYATLNEAKAALSIKSQSDPDRFVALERMVESASRLVDAWCHRQFYQETETRHFAAQATAWLGIDDLVSVTTLKTDDDGDRTYETTWAATDYYLEPVNAAAHGEPYTRIRLDAVSGDTTFSPYPKGVELAGVWGWPSVPKPIVEATLRIATWLWKLPGAPLGFAEGGGFEQGTAYIRDDRATQAMLSPYIKHAFFA